MMRVDLSVLPPRTLALFDTLTEIGTATGTVAYVVGGLVRDLVRGMPEDSTQDADIMADGDAGAFATAVATALHGTLRGPSPFMTYRIDYDADGPASMDVVTPRTETYAKPGRLPKVRKAPVSEDAVRRDFTVNAMAFRLPGPDPVLIDPFDGRADLLARRLHILHPGSFRDDPTRIVRAARFCVRCGLRLDADDLILLKEALPLLGTLSPSRLRHEMDLVASETSPTDVRALLKEWGCDLKP